MTRSILIVIQRTRLEPISLAADWENARGLNLERFGQYLYIG